MTRPALFSSSHLISAVSLRISLRAYIRSDEAIGRCVVGDVPEELVEGLIGERLLALREGAAAAQLKQRGHVVNLTWQ